MILLGASGILRVKKSSGPRGIIPMLKKRFPDTEWNEDKRWVIGGNIWSSGKHFFDFTDPKGFPCFFTSICYRAIMVKA
jgi:hypothetical protein